MRATATALGALAAMTALSPVSASAAIVRTPLGPPHEVALTDLLGRSPDEVREALAAGPAPWPVRYTLEVAEPGGGERAYLPMNDLLQDAAARDIKDRARTGASNLPHIWSQCAVKRSNAQTSSEVDDTYTSLLEFRQGHLTAIWPGRLPRSADLARLLQADGTTGFPSAAGLTALPVDTRLTASCTRYTAEPVQPRRGAPPGYNWPQALMLLPLAPALPVKNARRAAARGDGEALYDALAPGSAAPPALTDPAARSRLVQVEPTTAPDRALFRIDMGAAPGRNLTATDDYALVGVWRGQVTWRLRSVDGW